MPFELNTSLTTQIKYNQKKERVVRMKIFSFVRLFVQLCGFFFYYIFLIGSWSCVKMKVELILKKKKKMTKPFFALKRVVPLKVHPYFLVIFWLINWLIIFLLWSSENEAVLVLGYVYLVFRVISLLVTLLLLGSCGSVSPTHSFLGTWF